MKSKLLLLTLLLTSWSVLLQAQCSAAFTFTSTPNGAFVFTATGSNSPTATYNWSFGNGTSGSGNPATVVYNAPGTYTVCLTVIDSFCVDSSCVNVTYTGGVLGCSASYTNTVSGNTVSLTSTSTGANPLSYSWTANGTQFSTSATAIYTNTPGNYNICLYINDPIASCTDSFCSNITIGSSCQAGFYIYPDSNGPAHTYIGVNTTTGVGANGVYTWTWGDGSSSTGQYPSHTYAAAGNYVICLTVSDPNTLCVDSFCMNSTINKTNSMYSVNFANPTGLHQTQKQVLSLHPNPATDFLLIDGMQGQSLTAEVFTVNGARVKTQTLSGDNRLFIADLSRQFYVLKLSDQQGKSHYLKFLKN